MVPNLYAPGKRESPSAARDISREVGFAPDGPGTLAAVYRSTFFFNEYLAPDVTGGVDIDDVVEE